MSSTPPQKPGPPSLKDLIFTKNDSSIAARVKSFLPQIAKANEDLANIDADSRNAVIIEEYDSSSSEDDSASDEESETSHDESEGKKKWDKGDHISIDVYKYAENAESDAPASPDAKKSKPNDEKEDEDDDDFTIRLSVGKPNEK